MTSPAKPSIWQKILTPLMPILKTELDDLRDDAMTEVKAEIPILMDKVLALLPTLAAAAAKEVGEQVVEHFAKVLPVPVDGAITDVADIAETIRNTINSLSGDLQIPTLTDVLNEFKQP